MYTVKATNRFKKDLKTVIKRGYNTGIMDTVISNLANGNELDAKYCDHNLHGEWEGCRECHVLPDWLLIYKIDGRNLILYGWHGVGGEREETGGRRKRNRSIFLNFYAN